MVSSRYLTPLKLGVTIDILGQSIFKCFDVVILSIKDFENLLEDLKDLAITAERRDEETINHDDVLKELKRDGIL